MIKIYPSKKIITLLFQILFTSLIFLGCKKNSDIPVTDNGIPPDLTTKVKSSVSGFVTDENDLPVNLANVQVGTVAITTDKYGYFEVTNVDVVKEAAVVTVNKAGYFKGIKTYMAEESKSSFFRIKLIRKAITGTVNAAAGGAVTLTNGLSITLSANAVVNTTTNAAYTGTINVAAYWLNPTAADLPNTMPGDLRGINTDGNVQLLTTYGMAAIELTGSGGELLQIATGKKASLSLPIPSSLLSSAPATIPLWYFDETKGLWKQEGAATKTGNNYVGEVSHFSFWNADVPCNFVQFNCTVVNTFNQPVAFTEVKITDLSNPANYRYGVTNLDGHVSGPVPANSQLKLEILACSAIIHTQTFTTIGSNISLGTIIVNSSAFQANVSGTVTTCNNTPVTNGFIMLKRGQLFYRYNLTNSAYNFNIFLCTVSQNISIVAVDGFNSQESNELNYTIVSGSNTIPNIQACGVNAQEYIHYSIDGAQYGFNSPIDTFYTSATYNLQFIALFGQNVINPLNNTGLVMAFPAIAVGSNQKLLTFGAYQIPGNLTIPTPIFVHITEFSGPGQFMAGRFTGVLMGPAPTNTLYNITCSFRIRL